MIERVAKAGTRAVLVAVLMGMPTVLVPGYAPDAVQLILLLSLIAAVLTFVEYVGDYPSIIEFRDAPPFNRMRFLALFLTLFVLSMILRGASNPSALSQALTQAGTVLGHAMDFPYSPVRLMVLLRTEAMSAADVAMIRTSAGIAYLISLATMIAFFVTVRLLNWPIRRGAFNFWVNLPLFDPTTGGDVLYRLKRDGQVNTALGFLLPFLIPAVMKLASEVIDPISLTEPHTLIWTVSAWAFLPASLIMRGVALMRIAQLIEEKRRRAYAQADLQAI
ncbi:hypothetical protein [Salipiger mucosus]|uniref:Membrane protein n=1 Tax=Salipiger mucosus DSM 16094 TaxID=1123237 RepID=S9QTQ7_9RHOB|nr:hypothetical protein [Salipiger mucosus]EPX83012.1 membrane protein [Salipiger mucosus DSM 16094]